MTMLQPGAISSTAYKLHQTFTVRPHSFQPWVLPSNLNSPSRAVTQSLRPVRRWVRPWLGRKITETDRCNVRCDPQVQYKESILPSFSEFKLAPLFSFQKQLLWSHLIVLAILWFRPQPHCRATWSLLNKIGEEPENSSDTVLSSALSVYTSFLSSPLRLGVWDSHCCSNLYPSPLSEHRQILRRSWDQFDFFPPSAYGSSLSESFRSHLGPYLSSLTMRTTQPFLPQAGSTLHAGPRSISITTLSPKPSANVRFGFFRQFCIIRSYSLDFLLLQCATVIFTFI